MKKETTSAISVFFLATTLSSFLPAQGCVVSAQPDFTYTNHPDFPLEKYAGGHLGILRASYARSYLLPAYRYLANSPLSAGEQKGLVELWNTRLTSGDFSTPTDVTGWLQARAAVPGVLKLESIDTERSASKDDPWSYCNCQTNAFDTAANTLKALIDKFGAGSTAVKEWLIAQDQVFSNCSDPADSDKPQPAMIPAPLTAPADLTLQKNRSYQIASANFYAQNFEVARSQFEAIASDSSSPWRQISAYLAVRAMIRQASLAKELNKELLAAARQKLEQLAKDSSYASMAPDYAKLASYIAAKLTPEQHLQELSSKKLTTDSTGEITKTIDNLLGDQDQEDSSSRIQYSKLPASLKKRDDIDWIMTFQSSDVAAVHHAIERWKQTHSIPWLVAAAAATGADDPDVNAILTAAARGESGAARWTLFYHANRLKLAMAKADAVRADLDKVLNNPPADLPAGSLNQLKTQRLTLARNLDEFVRFGVQTPLAIRAGSAPPELDEIIKSGKLEKPEFTPRAGSVLQKGLALSILKELAGNQQLPGNLRNNVAWTSWVRAVLIGDDAAARELAQIARPLNTKKVKLFDAYLAAATPDARKFAAVFLMLHFSSAKPNASWGLLDEDSYGDASGWWWDAGPVAADIGFGDSEKPVHTFVPLFLTSAQRAQAKQQLRRLSAVETAPNYFARTVFAFSKAHPADPRAPEALHFLVKATRYGSADETTRVFSRQAFTLLHTKYKTSPWTKKTPCYY